MDGLNLKNCRDTFGFIDNIISIGMEIKKVFTRPKLTVNINNKVFNIIGRLGMYHLVVDIKSEECVVRRYSKFRYSAFIYKYKY